MLAAGTISEPPGQPETIFLAQLRPHIRRLTLLICAHLRLSAALPASVFTLCPLWFKVLTWLMADC